MMGLSPMKLLLIVAVVVLLFGAKRIPRLANDLGKGLRALRKGLQGDGGSDGDERH